MQVLLLPMPNNAHTHFSENSVPRRLQHGEVVTTARSVRQDKPHPTRDRVASPQPASLQKVTRSQRTSSNPPRSQNRPTTKRKTVVLTLWVHPLVKAEIQRIAQQEGISISATGAAFLEKAIQYSLYSQHTTLLDTVIEKAIGKHMRSYSTRIAMLLVRSLFASEQTRSIVTNILSRQPTVTQPVLAEILNGSSNAAKRNITRVTPQLQTILAEVEKWMKEEVKINE